MKNIGTTSQTTVRTILVPLLVFLPLHLSAQEKVGTIRGKVELPQIVLPQSRQQPMRYGSSMAPEEHDQSMKQQPAEVTNVVVHLDGFELDTAQRLESEAILSQHDATFIPHVLPIVRGTSVRIVNRDNTYHNVFSLSPTKRFNIGRRPKGEEVPVTFDKPGIVQVFCDIHSHMSAFILVLDNPMFAQPTADGNFEIDDVPPGKYNIQAWHERFSSPARPVTVTAGETSTVNFTLH